MTLTAVPEQSIHPTTDTAETPTVETPTVETPTTETPTTETPTADSVVVELTVDQVAPHPDNIRDAGRGIRELTASIAEVGVLVPLIVVPVYAVPDHDFPAGVTHVAVDGNRRQAAARAAELPCRASSARTWAPPGTPR